MFLIGEPKSILNFNFQFRVMIYAKIIFLCFAAKQFNLSLSTKVYKFISY